jgi:hypothetical protein
VTTLGAGVGVAPVEDRGEWIRVRTERGDDGWLEATVAETL